MSDWNFPHVFDYWDQRTGAINVNANRLHALSGPERQAACDAIRAAVEAHARVLSDEWLLQAAVSLADDLYKYVNDEVHYSQGLLDYLDAFGRTFTTAVRERGYVIHSVVENEFSGPDFLMVGPFDLFPKIFNAAGFVYICPQQLGWALMQGDGLAADAYEANAARYNVEARALAGRLAERCQAEGRHYVFLEANYEEGALGTALRGRGEPGVLSVFRNEAAVPGSNVDVAFPTRRLGPADSGERGE